MRMATRLRNHRMRLSLWVAAVLAGLCAAVPARAAIYRLEINGVINPVMSEYIVEGLDRAGRERADAVLLILRTPGGLVGSMSEIMEKMLSGRVPVVAYVGPGGSHAASAGFFLLVSADFAAMAPGTRTGAAHPILSIGGMPVSQNDTVKTLLEKVTNDSVASLQSVAQQRGRNEEMVARAIRDSQSYTERQALEGKLIERIAASEAELLQALDGRTIRLFHGREVVLRTAGKPVLDIPMSTRQKFLMAISDPNLALLLGIGGVLLLVFEFTNPGMIAPGLVGGLCLLVSLLGFSFLPIHYVGVLLILAALALFVLEIKLQSFGLLGIAGVVAMVLGSTILVKTPDPSLQVRLSTALAVGILFSALFLGLLYLALRSRKLKIATGTDAMVGAECRCLTALAPQGKVLVSGEYWDAVSQEPMEPGQCGQVVAVEGLTLKVKPKQ